MRTTKRSVKFNPLIPVLLVLCFLVIFGFFSKKASASLPILLDSQDAFEPPYVTCVHHDGFIASNTSSDCILTQSDGCNVDTNFCVLTSGFGYDNSSVVYNITIAKTWASYNPVINDGWIEVCIQFAASEHANLQGTLQLWYNLYDTANNEIYAFNYSQYVINDQIPNLSHCYVFRGLGGGRDWVPVFWPIGGTRYGNGYPELGPIVNLPATFPSVKPIRMKYIVPTPSGCSDFSVFGYARIGYMLAGFAGLETYLLQANNPPYNRGMMFSITTEWGNTVDMFYNPYDPSSGNYQICYWLMNQGGFKANIDISNPVFTQFQPANRVLISAKLVYNGFFGSQYADQWADAASRQVTGYFTLMASRFIDVVQNEIPDNVAVTAQQANCNGSLLYAEKNSRMMLSVGPNTDRVWTYWTRQRQQACYGPDIPYDNNIYNHYNNAVFRTFNYGDQWANGFTYHDYISGYLLNNDNWTPVTTASPGAFQIMYYADYDNTFMNDLPCVVTGSAFAAAASSPSITNCWPATGIIFNNYAFVRYSKLPTQPATTCAYTISTQQVCSSPDFLFTDYDVIDPTNIEYGNCDCCNEEVTNQGAFLCVGYSTFPTPNTRTTSNSYFGVAFCGIMNIRFPGGYNWANLGVSQDCTHSNTPLISCMPGVPLPGGTRLPGTQLCYWSENSGAGMAQVYRPSTDFPVTSEYHMIVLTPTPYIVACGGSDPTLLTPTTPLIWNNVVRNVFGQVPPDSAMVANRYERQVDNRVTNNFYGYAAFGTATLMNARYQKHPTIEFYDFRNSLPGSNGQPDTIEISFGVYCDSVATGRLTYIAYCAEQFTLAYTSNPTVSIVLDVLLGTVETARPSYIPATWPPGSVIGQVLNYTYFRLKILYLTGDIQITMLRRSIPEQPFDVAYCNWTSGVIATTPPKGLIWMPLIAIAEVAAPECPYSPQTMICEARRGFFFIWQNVISLDLAATASLGVSIYQQQDISYYYDWLINGTTYEGYSQDVQLYEFGSTVTVYDRISKVSVNSIVNYFFEPTYPNPLKRPPQCSDPVSELEDVCPINPADDPYQYAGINEFQIWDASLQIEYTILTPRLITNYPFTVSQNIRSWFFNLTTEFIDIFILSQQIAGINYQQTSQVVYASSVWTLFISYGKYDGPILITPCWERMITSTNVLSQFSFTVYSITYIAGCNATASCCYQLNYIVSGNTPSNGGFVNFDNTTDVCYNSARGVCSGYVNCANTSDPCYNTCPCRYQLVTSPSLASSGGYCLGSTYTITVQNRPTDIFSRNMPSGYPTGLPYREPVTITYQIPNLGVGPVSVIVFPGDCDNRGNKFRVSFTVNNPLCSGPVTSFNLNPECAFNLYFALTSLNNPTYPGPTPTHGLLLSGNDLFSYNFEGSFVFADILGGLYPAIPNGYWQVYVWAVQPSAINQGYSGAQVVYQQEVSVVASLINGQSMVMIVEGSTRPRCPDDTPITFNMILYDTLWNGPYYVYWSTPTGRLISTQTLTVYSFPSNAPCCFGSDYETCIETCTTAIQTRGLPFTLYVGTGIYSPGENGGYNLTIYANSSTCEAQNFLVMNALNPLILQVACLNSTCANQNDGFLSTAVNGGTQIPLEFRNDEASGGSSPYGPPYTYNISSPFGYLITKEVFNAPDGNYTVYVSDYNNCTVNKSCVISPRSSLITLYPIGEIPPNCTDLPAIVTFGANGGYGNLTLVRLSNSTITIINGSYIMQDANAVPGQPQLYAAMDSLGCFSASVLYTAENAPPFYVTVNARDFPCTEGVNSGDMFATVPFEYAPVVYWYYVSTGYTLVFVGEYFVNAPAGLYYVKAVASFNTSCYADTLFNLYAVGTPQIVYKRYANSGKDANIALGTFIAEASSVNGPPFTYAIYPANEPTDPAPYISFYAGQGNYPATLTILNLLNSFSFDLMFEDSGGCKSTTRFQGESPPDTIQPVKPTPIPNTTVLPKHGEAVALDSFTIGMIILVALAIFVILFMVAYIQYQRDYLAKPPQNIHDRRD
jgi:hypothetical protein